MTPSSIRPGALATSAVLLLLLAACTADKRDTPQDSAAQASPAATASATAGTGTRPVAGSAVAAESAAATAAPAGQLSATPSAPPGVAGAALVDGRIANELLVTNAVDSTSGALAVGRAQRAAVKAFAQMMVRDHGAANRRVIALVQRAALAPSESQESRALMAGAEQAAGATQSASGADFDRAYMAEQIRFHQSALDAIDQRLLPRASTPELRALLQQQRASVAAHLQRAQKIRRQLGG